MCVVHVLLFPLQLHTSIPASPQVRLHDLPLTFTQCSFVSSDLLMKHSRQLTVDLQRGREFSNKDILGARNRVAGYCSSINMLVACLASNIWYESDHKVHNRVNSIIDSSDWDVHHHVEDKEFWVRMKNWQNFRKFSSMLVCDVHLLIGHKTHNIPESTRTNWNFHHMPLGLLLRQALLLSRNPCRSWPPVLLESSR